MAGVDSVFSALLIGASKFLSHLLTSVAGVAQWSSLQLSCPETQQLVLMLSCLESPISELIGAWGPVWSLPSDATTSRKRIKQITRESSSLVDLIEKLLLKALEVVIGKHE